MCWTTSTKCTMLKDRDFYGKSPIFASNAPGVGEGLRGGYGRRRVRGEDGRRRVGGGGNVGCSVECDTEW